ncbi:DUF6895 family protein [Streptomyces sp. NPDC005876]|uniref:DUF6895 family protein n=1 Tax=unclassified Streptomyces TaxID=2593676 RepID=UPI0033C2AA08
MSGDAARTTHTAGSRALGWLHRHRRLGALAGEDPDTRLDTYKALGETALTACLVLHHGAAGSRERVLARELLEFCWSELDEGLVLYQRLLRHPLATDPVELYGHLAGAGLRHPGMERLLPHFAAVGTARIVEHVPNRRLAVANALRMAGHGHRLEGTEWHRLTRATWLGNLPVPWQIDWATGYAVTHTVYHLTDWGRRPDGMPHDMTEYFSRWLPVWLDIWSETRQWDLVSELLLAGLCLDEPYDPADDLRRLAEQQHEDGLMPSDGRPVGDDPVTRFQDHQHTTLVAAATMTLALARSLDVGGGSSGNP